MCWWEPWGSVKQWGGGEEVSTLDRFVRMGKPTTWVRRHSPSVPLLPNMKSAFWVHLRIFAHSPVIGWEKKEIILMATVTYDRRYTETIQVFCRLHTTCPFQYCCKNLCRLTVFNNVLVYCSNSILYWFWLNSLFVSVFSLIIHPFYSGCLVTAILAPPPITSPNRHPSPGYKTHLDCTGKLPWLLL